MRSPSLTVALCLPVDGGVLFSVVLETPVPAPTAHARQRRGLPQPRGRLRVSTFTALTTSTASRASMPSTASTASTALKTSTVSVTSAWYVNVRYRQLRQFRQLQNLPKRRQLRHSFKSVDCFDTLDSVDSLEGFLPQRRGCPRATFLCVKQRSLTFGALVPWLELAEATGKATASDKSRGETAALRGEDRPTLLECLIKRLGKGHRNAPTHAIQIPLREWTVSTFHLSRWHTPPHRGWRCSSLCLFW
jgi:hypothetical protein